MKSLVVLDEDAVTRMRKAVGDDSDLLIGLGDWLSHLNLFSDAQIYEALKFVKPEVKRFEEDTHVGLHRPVPTLAVCDYRWVSFTGIPMFWDMKTSDLVPDLGEYAVTHIVCDLAALRLRMRYRQGRFNGKPDIEQDSPTLHEAGEQST